MKKFITYGAGFIASLALFLCLLSSPVQAHGTEQHAEEPAVVQPATTARPTAYIFIAEPGDSLSLMVRRSLQLHTNLEPSPAMFCEDSIVRALGAYRLEIGQEVSIPYDLLDSCSGTSKNLSPEQIAAWQCYADMESFNIEYINPVAGTGSEGQVDAPGNNQTTQEESTPEETATADDKKDNDVGSYWWYIGAATLVLLYFILGGPTPTRSRQ